MSGVCHVTCSGFGMKYIGLKDTNFLTASFFKNCNNKSKYAQHLVEIGHPCGKFEEIMQILHISEKGYYLMNTVQNKCTYFQVRHLRCVV